MQTKTAVLLLLLMTVLCSLSQADIDKNDVASSLKAELSHPYLYFSADEKAAILERINRDPEANEIFRRELAEANRLIHTPVENDPPKRNTNARYEANYQFESFLMRNAEASYRLAFVYQMTGDVRYAKKSFEFADVLCDQPTWVHSVHEFPDIYDRVWPMGAGDDQPAFGYSQHADHYVFRMAAVYDWLYDALTKRERDRIRGALLEKAILRVRGNYEYHWWASAYRCNWCTVCNSSLGVAAIALLTEDPNLIDVVAESYNRIGKTLDEIKSGGWQEGLGYLNYTVRTAITFAEALKRATNGELNLYEHPRFDDAVTTFLYAQVPPNKSLHFGDSGGGRTGSYGMFNDLMLERKNRTAAFLRDELGFGSPANFMDIIKPKSDLSPWTPDNTSILFPSVNWVIMRSDFTDTDKFVIAGKSGMNDDPHHGHLDCGHFSLYWRGCEFLSDNGSAGYDKAYFDDARWDYPLATTGGHNCVIVNGEAQEICKRKNQDWDMRYGGKIIEFRPRAERDYVLMDPSNAYPGKELKSWRRHIVFDKPNIAVVLDEVAADKGAEIELRFHSAAKQTVGKSHTILDNKGDRMALLSAADTAFQLRAGSHKVLMAQRNAKMKIVPYVSAVATAKQSKTIFASVMFPAGDNGTVEAAAQSLKLTKSGGNVTVTFTADGEKRQYVFSDNGEGLALIK